MPVTYRRQDDLEKLFETFASFDEMEKVEFPDPKSAPQQDESAE